MGLSGVSRRRGRQLARMIVVALVILAGDPDLSASGRVPATVREPAARTRWRVPQSSVLTKNPVTATRQSLASGERIFMTRCADCHGERGRGYGKVAHELPVAPAVLSDLRVQEQSDGVLWWKITFGKRPMPAFAFRLSAKERWEVINYLRTLRSDELALARKETRPH